VRDQRLPGDCHPDPGDHATATPPGPADSAARTATAGLPPATGETGSGAQSGASSAALRPLRGGIPGAATLKSRFLSSGAITQRNAPQSPSATTLSRLSQGSQRPSSSNLTYFQAGFPYFATHRRGLNYCPLSHLLAAADQLSHTLPRRPGGLLARLSSPCHTPSRGRAGTGLRTGGHDLTYGMHVRRATDDCFTSCARI
jgi:hypothetical protein